MLKFILKPGLIFDVDLHSLKEMVDYVIHSNILMLQEDVIADLKKLYEKKVSNFPTSLGHGNMMLHLYHPFFTKSYLMVLRNRMNLSMREKDPREFNVLFFLLTPRDNLPKYARLKGRIIRLLEDDEINRIIREETSRISLLDSLFHLENKILKLPY